MYLIQLLGMKSSSCVAPMLCLQEGLVPDRREQSRGEDARRHEACSTHLHENAGPDFKGNYGGPEEGGLNFGQHEGLNV